MSFAGTSGGTAGSAKAASIGLRSNAVPRTIREIVLRVSNFFVIGFLHVKVFGHIPLIDAFAKSRHSGEPWSPLAPPEAGKLRMGSGAGIGVWLSWKSVKNWIPASAGISLAINDAIHVTRATKTNAA